MRDVFINAIHSKNKLRITYFSHKAGEYVTRVCAPMDYGPLKKDAQRTDRYHFWDFDGANGPHVVSEKPNNIRSIDAMTERYEPREFVTWVPDWIIPRDWAV